MPRMAQYPRVLPLGDTGFTVEFGDTVDPAIHDRVLAFARAAGSLGLRGLQEIVPTYRSAAVFFDPVQVDAPALMDRLRAIAESPPVSSVEAARLVEIAVLYGGEFGPDLSDVAAFARLTPDEVIVLHTSVDYRVFMLGFSPGFPYLGPVPEPLGIPRLSEPRARVPAGSVGLAGSQTGIYPLESPGGWRIIGRTPLRLYDPAREAPFLLQAGDRVRFRPIDREAYDRLAERFVH